MKALTLLLTLQNLLPRPVTTTPDSGTFVLRSPVRIVARQSELRAAAGYLRDALATATGYEVRIGGAAATSTITLELHAQPDSAEAYALIVAPGGVRITGGGVAGVLWGIQTLRQLLPPEAESPSGRRDAWSLPAVTIRDAPRFAWRGALLDVSRHFFTVPEVERFIELLSRYKLNVLHWHLTEDQGWRLEIRRYPRLTSVGAWRTEADGTRSGGFYTQAEARHIVAFARLRGVTVVPEIEMPGHSSAAIAAYPWLGCTGDSIAVPITWGVFDDIYCVGHQRTLTFIDNVLDEVLAIFPSRYIHIGGDEVPKGRWRNCPECQALMRREGLRDEAELQSWFTRRVERRLASRGRRLIGWDEILEGGLAPGAAVQVWRDTAAITAAVRLGADVVASPTDYAYIDKQPGSLPVARVYAFEPVPPWLTDAEARHVLGGEAPLWSEHINSANLDLMAFPRLLAFSEALWGPRQRNLADFQRRLDDDHRTRLRSLGVRVGPDSTDLVSMTVAFDTLTGRTGVRVQRGSPDIVVRYSTDGREPTAASPSYPDSLTFDRDTVVLRAFVDTMPMIARRQLTFEAHLGRGHAITLTASPSSQYPGTGSQSLTDGLLGSDDFHDGLWQGWIRSDLEAVIDLGSVQNLREVSGSFLQAVQSWILMPGGMSVALSDNGLSWREAGSATHDVPATQVELVRRRMTVSLPAGTAARYVKVLARGSVPLPAGHAGAGRPAWIFADEVIIH